MRPRALPVIAVMCLLVSCSGESDVLEDNLVTPTTEAVATTETTAAKQTTTLAPSTTTTTAPSPPEAKYPVTVTTGLSGGDTQEITVWAPDADGLWPVVYALPGWGGRGQDFGETATALAGQGVLVFASDYRWDAWEEGRWEELTKDGECGYRYVRSIADEYGGDLNQPVAFIGHSFGSTMALWIGLNGPAYGPNGTYDECFTGVPRPDVIVPLGSCVYEFEGNKFDFDPSGWENPNLETDLISVSGSEDDICEAWQSEDATDAYQAVGFNARHVTIVGANHYNLILHDIVDGEWLALPDDPSGIEVVQTILNAIDAAAS